MAEEFKNIIKVACIYATTIIGAGFASGQEILQFFSTYKTGGFFGIILAGLLFSAVGCIILEKVYSNRIRNYEEFLFPTFGWFIGWLVEAAVTLFMLCLFCIMIAGSGSVISDRLGIRYNFAVLFMSLLTMFLIFTNIKGIVALSTFITPVMIAGIMLAGLSIILFNNTEAFKLTSLISHITGNWLTSSLLYVSYNSILAVVMMCSLLPYLKTRRTARMGGILGGVMLCVTALIVNTALFLFYPSILEKELPFLAILKNFSSSAGYLYAIILWMAMLTSAVTSGYCFAERTSNSLRLDRKLVALVLCAMAVPMSTLGFSRLISIIYPVFGYLGLFMILVILVQGLVSIRKGSTGGYGRK